MSSAREETETHLSSSSSSSINFDSLAEGQTIESAGRRHNRNLNLNGFRSFPFLACSRPARDLNRSYLYRFASITFAFLLAALVAKTNVNVYLCKGGKKALTISTISTLASMRKLYRNFSKSARI